jgi:hypothetical protein
METQPVLLAWTPILPSMVPVVSPDQPRSRMKAVMPDAPLLVSVLAKTRKRSATLERVIHIFSPLRM